MPAVDRQPRGGRRRAGEGRASGIRWSEGSTSTIASGSRRAARQAASVTAARVSRPSGSSASSIAAPTAAAWSATRKRDAAALMTIGSAKSSTGEPTERALERRGAAEQRHVLLGEVAARHRPQPRARAAAEHRRHQRAGRLARNGPPGLRVSDVIGTILSCSALSRAVELPPRLNHCKIFSKAVSSGVRGRLVPRAAREPKMTDHVLTLALRQPPGDRRGGGDAAGRARRRHHRGGAVRRRR